MRISFALSIVLLFFAACGKDKDVKNVKLPTHTSRLCISSDLCTGDSVKVLISSSLPSLSKSKPSPLAGAKVTLYENEVEKEILIQNPKTLYYVGKSVAVANRKYTIKATHPNYENSEGSTIMPYQSFHLSNLKTDIKIGVNPKGESYRYGQISFNFDQTKNEGYAYKFTITDEEEEAGVNYEINSNNSLFVGNSNPILNNMPDVLKTTSDKMGSTQVITIQINAGKFSMETEFEDHLVLTIEILNNDHNKFDDSINKYYDSEGNPFSEAVTIYNNVSNGYGIIMGKHKTKIVLGK